MKTWEKAKQALLESLEPPKKDPLKIIKLTFDSPDNPGFERTEYYKTLEEARVGINRHTADGEYCKLEIETVS